MLTDFDLSKQARPITAPMVQQSFFSKLLGSDKDQPMNVLQIDTTSFVGTEEYIAPEVIQGTQQSSAVDWWTFGVLAYEMAFGFTPFRGNTQQATFSNICSHDKIRIPEKPATSQNFKKMVTLLLERQPAKRLGSRLGAADLKRCGFFNDVKWADLPVSKPPFVPPEENWDDPRHYLQTSASEDGDSTLDMCLRWAPEVRRLGSAPSAPTPAAAAPTPAAATSSAANAPLPAAATTPAASTPAGPSDANSTGWVQQPPAPSQNGTEAAHT